MIIRLSALIVVLSLTLAVTPVLANTPPIVDPRLACSEHDSKPFFYASATCINIFTNNVDAAVAECNYFCEHGFPYGSCRLTVATPVPPCHVFTCCNKSGA